MHLATPAMSSLYNAEWQDPQKDGCCFVLACVYAMLNKHVAMITNCWIMKCTKRIIICISIYQIQSFVNVKSGNIKEYIKYEFFTSLPF